MKVERIGMYKRDTKDRKLFTKNDVYFTAATRRFRRENEIRIDRR